MKPLPATETEKETKVIVRKCHNCGQITESQKEMNKCVNCRKSFLPTQYFEKIHSATNKNYNDLFSSSSELEEQDLVKGLFVLW